MTAKDNGYIRGREYLQRCRIESVTFQQYRNLGIVDAKQQYKRKEKQNEYLLGWWQAGEQFLTLFRQTGDSYQTQKSVQSIRERLAALSKEIEAVLEAQDDNLTLQHMLQDAFEELDKSQITLNDIHVYLKYPQEKE